MEGVPTAREDAGFQKNTGPLSEQGKLSVVFVGRVGLALS
jgi:hypothetical protein